MKRCFEVDFRFFDCCGRKVLARHGRYETKVIHNLYQTGLLANNVAAASRRPLA